MPPPPVVSCVARAAGSGETILVSLLDGSGDPTNVTSYATAFTQLVQINGAGGSFQIAYRGQTLMDVPLGADEETLQSGLEALSTIGMGNVTVQGDGYPYLITLDPSVTQAAFSVDDSTVLASVAATPLTAGTTAQQIFDATVGANFEKVGAAWSGSGFSSGAGWKIAADGSGLNSAEWTITGLATGNYSIYYSNSGPTGSGNATTVPWRFLDDDTIRSKILVNQQALVPYNFSLPGDLTGDAYQLLATVYVASGTLRISVSDQVDAGDIGNLVCVNKIGVVPVDPSENLIFDTVTPYALLVGTWTGDGGGWNNHEQFNNTPGGSVTWLFMGLIPGSTYKVQSMWTNAGNRATNCVYSILDSDGVTVLGAVSVNQQNAPSGGLTLTDLVDQSWTFENFGTFTPTGTSLRVSLPVASDSGHYTMASAALVQLQSAAGYAEAVSSSVANLSTGPPAITVNGTDTRTLSNVIWGVDQNPAVNYMGFLVPGDPLLDTDAVTISISGSSIGTAAGILPVVTDQAVTNRVGRSMGLTMPSVRPLKAGWNFYQIGPGFVPIYANMVKSNSGWAIGSGVTLTADLLPEYTAFNQTARMGFGQPAGVNPTSDEGYPLWPLTGTTTFILDGATAGFPTINAKTGTTMAFQAMDTGHATGNTIAIDFAVDGSNTTFAPQFDFYAPTGLLDICDDADTGRFAITAGAWTVQSGGWNGHYHRNSHLVTDKAIFNFGARAAGNWEAAISWVPDAGNTTTANVVVKEDGVQIASETVDQTLSPGNHATNDYNGTTLLFNAGVAFICAGGIITVELTGGTDGYCIADAVRIVCDDTLGSPITPMTDFKVYPPDPGIDPLDPPKYHPILLSTLAGAGSLRSMIILDVIYGCYHEIDDYASSTQLYYGGTKQNQYTVTQAETWSDPNGFWTSNADLCPVLLTVTPIDGAPLPLTQGFKVTCPTPLIVKYTDWTSENGRVVDCSGVTVAIEYDPDNMAENQFAVGNLAFGPHALTTLNPTPPSTANFGRTGIPIADFIEICVLLGCDCHLNLASTVSEACVTAVGELWKSIVSPGTIKLIEEIANEPWNFLFPDFNYFSAIAVKYGLGAQMKGYAKVASERHAWMTTALGSRSGELIRMYNTQFGLSSTVQDVFDYCNTNSEPVDLVMVAAYLGPWPKAQTGLTATYELLTAAQTCDFADAWLNIGPVYSSVFAGTQALVEAQSVAAPLSRTCHWGVYEGGQASSDMGGSSLTKELQSFAGRYHPLEYPVTLSYLAMLQFYGATYYNHYAIDQSPGSFQSDAVDVMFGVYYAYGALAGYGDGSDGKHNNLPDIAGAPPGVVNFNTAVTPIGQAYNDWNAVPVVATTYTLVAPSPATGKVGTASGNFTVQCDGVPEFPVTITPLASTGTFTPSSLLISDADPHTLKYTATSVGIKTISCVNDNGLIDPTGVSFTVYGLALLPSTREVAVNTAATLTATLTGGTGSLSATKDVGTLSTASPTSGTPFTLTTPSSGSGHATVTVTGPGGTSAVAKVYYPVSNSTFWLYEETMNFLPNNYRINALNGLQVPIPANKITFTLSPYTIVTGGTKAVGADVAVIAPSDGSEASAAIPAGGHGASVTVTGNTNLSGDIAAQVDLTGVAGLKPGGTISFYLQICGTAINPPNGSGLVVLVIHADSAGTYTGTACLDSLLPQLV